VSGFGREGGKDRAHANTAKLEVVQEWLRWFETSGPEETPSKP
jgi:hypothetical protein